MNVIGFKQDDVEGIFRLVAAILHLGNINFVAGEKDEAIVANKEGAHLPASWPRAARPGFGAPKRPPRCCQPTPPSPDLELAAKTFGVPTDALEGALTSRTVKDSSKFGKDVSTPLSVEQATYSRDALAKAVYDRLFSYIVRKINENIFFRDQSNRAVIGVLDIYGFEILEVRCHLPRPPAQRWGRRCDLALTLKAQVERRGVRGPAEKLV